MPSWKEIKKTAIKVEITGQPGFSQIEITCNGGKQYLVSGPMRYATCLCFIEVNFPELYKNFEVKLNAA